MSCGVGRRCGSDLLLLWLWCRPAAVAPIRPPSLRTAICCNYSPKNQKKKKKSIIEIIVDSHAVLRKSTERSPTGNILQSSSCYRSQDIDIHVIPPSYSDFPCCTCTHVRCACVCVCMCAFNSLQFYCVYLTSFQGVCFPIPSTFFTACLPV